MNTPSKTQDSPSDPKRIVDKDDQHRARTQAVDHERESGVPPETADDYGEDQEDYEGAESFPASDPPANY